MEKKIQAGKTWPTIKVHFARAFQNVRYSNKPAGTSGYLNLVSHMQTDIQKIANEYLQALVNYANKLAADTNSIETLKEQKIEMKGTQTAANENNCNLIGQVVGTRQDYSGNLIDKEDGIIIINQYKGKNHQQGGQGGQVNRREH